MKKSIKAFIILLIISICCSQSFSQEIMTEKKNEINSNAIGFAGLLWDWTSCVGGINYQHWFENGLGLSLTGGGYDLKSSSFDNGFTVYQDIYYSFAAELQYKFISIPRNIPFHANFYSWVLGGIIGEINDSFELINNACAAGGFGYELIYGDRLSIPVQIGFASKFPVKFRAGFCAGVGVRIRF